MILTPQSHSCIFISNREKRPNKYKPKERLGLALDIEQITEIPYSDSKICDIDPSICAVCFKAMVILLLANALIPLQ